MIKPQRILFTGITGLLGGYFLKQTDQKYEIIGVGNKSIQKSTKNSYKVDITDRSEISNFIKKIKPVIIVHAASIGNVDYCEKNPEEAYKVNVEGTGNIINVAKEVGARIIFLSSNAIYDGGNPPYHEKSNINPLDIYGKTKAEGEKLILRSGLKYVIVRLITMYGWPQKGGRNNPVTWVIDNLKKGQNLNIVTDVYNNHLWAGQAAEVLWKVIQKNIENDVYNIAGGESISRFDLARKVAKIFKLNSSLISPVRSDFFKSIAIRPKNTSFDTAKMEKILGIKPLKVDEGLRMMMQEYF